MVSSNDQIRQLQWLRATLVAPLWATVPAFALLAAVMAAP